MNERGHYGNGPSHYCPPQIGQYSSGVQYVMDPEYRHFEQERLRRDIGDNGISTQGKVILGVAAALIVGIGVVGAKHGVRFM